MDLRACEMIMLLAFVPADSLLPEAIVIAVAPSKEEAEEHAKQELKTYYSPDSYRYMALQTAKEMTWILFPPIPTTVFFYIKGAGRIK